ncbi:MAG: TetR/AcrR family transcriptional regulator [Lachnospiraceae bacterium]|nr:TetR/AcrR family transcriptional regulator [Lachnospiraceae bacterium]
MYKKCVTEQSARRQRELENGLLAAMAAQRYEDITISSLCEDMGIPRKCFYRYFSSKDGALYALIDHTLMDFSGEMFTGEIQATLETLERFFQFWQDQHLLLTAMERNGLTGLLIQRSINYTLMHDMLPKRILHTDSYLSQEHMVIFLISGLLSLVFQWYYNDFQTSPKQLAFTAAHLLTQPMIAMPSPMALT